MINYLTGILCLFIITIAVIFHLITPVHAGFLDNTNYPKVKFQIEEACKRYEASNCRLVKAIIWRESSFRLKLKQHVDVDNRYVYGGMRIKCGTAKINGLKFGCEQLASDPMIGLRFGILELERQLKLNNYNIDRAIAGYNSGTTIVCRNVNLKHNKVLCFPNEFINAEYVWQVKRRYRYLEQLEGYYGPSYNQI